MKKLIAGMLGCFYLFGQSYFFLVCQQGVKVALGLLRPPVSGSSLEVVLHGRSQSMFFKMPIQQNSHQLPLCLHPTRYTLKSSAGERVTSWEYHQGGTWCLLIGQCLKLTLQ